MGLAVSNIRLLSLTARKADCEYNISIDSMKKMALPWFAENLNCTRPDGLRSPPASRRPVILYRSTRAMKLYSRARQ